MLTPEAFLQKPESSAAGVLTAGLNYARIVGTVIKGKRPMRLLPPMFIFGLLTTARFIRC